MSASASEFELFKTLSNPRRTDFTKSSVVSHALEKELHKIDTDPPTLPCISPRSSHHSRTSHRSNVSKHSRTSYRSNASVHSQEDSGEKQSLLVELNQLKMDGVTLSRAFTMDDSVGDMRFEVNRIRANGAASDAGAIATSALFVLLGGIEQANTHFGPIAHLTGWSTTVTKNQNTYNSVFSQLYKKHFRKGGGLSPEVQLAMLIGGSAIATHMGNSSDAARDMFKNTMPNLNPTQPASEQAGAFSKRPPMRRPSPIPTSEGPGIEIID